MGSRHQLGYELGSARDRERLARDSLLSTHSVNNSGACPMCGALCQAFKAPGWSRAWFHLSRSSQNAPGLQIANLLELRTREVYFCRIKPQPLFMLMMRKRREGGPWRGGGGVDKCLCAVDGCGSQRQLSEDGSVTPSTIGSESQTQALKLLAEMLLSAIHPTPKV